MLFLVCSKCNQAKWLASFRTRKRGGTETYRSWCKSCESVYNAKKNREKIQNDEEYRKESIKRVSDWGLENKDRRLKADADRRRNLYSTDEAYKSSAMAQTAMRRAAKQKATPPWLTANHKNEILSKYEECSRVSSETNIPHDVDHIVPLLGKTACGLHVPWNLEVIPASKNRSKGNAYNDWVDFNPSS